MTDGTSPQPPGWYYAQGDPPGTHRYWDGELWQGGPVPLAPATGGYYAPHPTRGSDVEWFTRVGAKLLDMLLAGAAFLVVFIAASVLAGISDALGVLVGLSLGLPALFGVLYLLLWVPGITGQSPGRRIMGYEIVSERDGSYIGGGAFLGREIVGSVINNFCYIDYLWPLWDDKRQRLADKVVSSIAVRKDAGPLFPLFPNGRPF